MNFTMDSTTIAFALLIIVILILISFIIYLNQKLNKFLLGSDSKNLADSIDSIKSSLKESEIFKNEMEKYLISVEKRLHKSIQSIHTVRFNPFKGTGSGGNQSFATAIINQDESGVVISSIYSREHTSVFSKPIKNGISEYELSNEEKEAIEEAKKMLE
ncbi:MAG: DUF4446 family protein [Patescibacteria group bacterium]